MHDYNVKDDLINLQLNGEYRVKNENLIPLNYHVLTLIKRLDHFTIEHVRREKNAHADKMANEGIDLHTRASSPLFKNMKLERMKTLILLKNTIFLVLMRIMIKIIGLSVLRV